MDTHCKTITPLVSRISSVAGIASLTIILRFDGIRFTVFDTGNTAGLRSNRRIVIVTDYDDAKLRRAARDAGACAYVLKDDLLELRRISGGQGVLEH